MVKSGLKVGRWIAAVVGCVLCGVVGAGVAVFGPGGNPAGFHRGFPIPAGRCDEAGCAAPDAEAFIVYISSEHERVNDAAEWLARHASLPVLGQGHRVDVALRDIDARAQEAGWTPVFAELDDRTRSDERAWARVTSELEVARVGFPFWCEMFGDSDHEHLGLCGYLRYGLYQYPLPPLHRGFPLCRQAVETDYAPLETDAGEALTIPDSDDVACQILAPELWGWHVATAQPDRKDSVAFERDGERVEVSIEDYQRVLRFTP
jgi:hypothetical protein